MDFQVDPNVFHEEIHNKTMAFAGITARTWKETKQYSKKKKKRCSKAKDVRVLQWALKGGGDDA